MLDAPPLSSSYGMTRTASTGARPAPSGLDRVLSHTRSGILSTSASLVGRSVSSDSAISLAGGHSNSQQYPIPRASATGCNAPSLDSHHSDMFGEACYSRQHTASLHSARQARNEAVTTLQVIDLDNDSPQRFSRQRSHQRHAGMLRQSSSGTVDLTGESPPVQNAPRRHTDRIDLDRIGSSTSSNGFSSAQIQQNTSQTARNRLQHNSRVANHRENAIDLAGAPYEDSPSSFATFEQQSAHTGQNSRRAVNRMIRGQQNQPRCQNYPCKGMFVSWHVDLAMHMVLSTNPVCSLLGIDLWVCICTLAVSYYGLALSMQSTKTVSHDPNRDVVHAGPVPAH